MLCLTNESRYRLLEAQLNYFSGKKDLYLDAQKILKAELGRTEDKIGEITKQLLALIDEMRKS